MSNLINATVYQIDGNPQKVATVVAFDTSKIRLQQTTLSTIPQVVSFIEVQGEKLNAPVVKYFVSESVATLVAAANIGGVTLLQATIVAINENPFKTSLQMAFPANKVTVWEFINGTIQSFLQFNEDKFYAIESKSDLVSTANSSSYKVFTALLTQSGGDDIANLSNGLLTIGVTYLILDWEGDGVTGVDFTNVGAPNNNQGTYFVATGTIPNSWGTNPFGAGILQYNTGAPVATVLENTIGNIWFTYNGDGSYILNSENLFIENKTYSNIQIMGDESSSNLFTRVSNGTNVIYISSGYIDTGLLSNNILTNTPIEIRVYN